MRVPAAVAAIPLLISVAAGILFVDSIPERHLLAAAAGAALALVAACGFHTDRLDSTVTWTLVAGFALAGLSIGASCARTLYDPPLVRLLKTTLGGAHDPITLEGVLRADAAATEHGVSIVVDARSVQTGGAATGIAGGVRLTVGGAVPRSAVAAWRAGRTVQMPVLLRHPSTFRNPGVPDDGRMLQRRGIALVGTVKSAALVDVTGRGGPLEEAFSATRARARTVIARHVGRLDPTSAGIALSILIGDRSGLSDTDERRLQDAGTYHVIAISGGNIAILTGLLVLLARLLRLPRRTALLATIGALLVYGEIAGGAPSVSRAVAAAVLFLAAALLDHRASPLNTLAVAATLGLAVAPANALDAGFLLSFAATGGIVVGVPRMVRAAAEKSGVARAPQPARLIFNGAIGLLAATVCAEIAIAPIAATFFSRVTAAGLIVNFAAIPLMMIVQVGSLLLPAVASFSATGADAVGVLVHYAASGLLGSAGFVEAAPWLARDVPVPAWWVWVIYYGACVAVLVRLARVRVCLGLMGVAVALLVGGAPAAGRVVAAPAPGILRVVVLDVGQGDATLATLPDGSTIMVDAAGLAGTSFDIGGRVLVPAMRALGIERLHALVITHGDPDHISGADTVLRRFRPSNVWEGVPVPPHAGLRALIERANAQRVVWRTVRPGDVQEAGGVEVRVLHPPAPEWERQRVRNDDSIVLELRYHDVSVVLPGDVGRDVERDLIPTLDLSPLVVLKAAHHGSATSSSEEFLEAANPRAVIFSAGRNNRFGHPAQAVVERFARRGVETFNTAHDGAVFVETDGRTVEVRGWVGRRVKLTR